jgi:hypothetical protein
MFTDPSASTRTEPVLAERSDMSAAEELVEELRAVQAAQQELRALMGRVLDALRSAQPELASELVPPVAS